MRIPASPKLLLRATLILLLAASPLHGATLSLDQNFHAPSFVEASPAVRMTLLPDGKFLRFHTINTLVDQATGPITRYLPDGTLDSSFQPLTGYATVSAAVPAANGKLIVAAFQNLYSSGTEKILRLNADGSIDATFTATVIQNYSSSPLVGGIAVQPDGKIIVTGSFDFFGPHNHAAITRLLADGGPDPSFTSPLLFSSSSGTFEAYLPIGAPALQADGKIIIFGPFRRVQSTNFPTGVARLNSDGSLDSSFAPTGFTPSSSPRAAVIQADGQILVGGRFTVTSSYTANPTHTTYRNLPIVRLTATGAADQTYGYFSVPAHSNFNIRDLALQTDGKLVATDQALSGAQSTVYRFSTDGTLDSGFASPLFAIRNPPNFLRPTPYLLAVQSDGRILVSGSFTDIDDGSPIDDSHFGIVRLNSNGTVDPTLTTAHKTGYKTYPTSFARQPDGSTIIGFHINYGAFETSVPNNLGRLLADGALDSSFHLSIQPNDPLQSDFVADNFGVTAQGRFLLGGYDANADFAYGRILPNGTQDPSFFRVPNVEAFAASYALPDGRMLVANSSAQAVIDYSSLRFLAADGRYDESAFGGPLGQVYRFPDGTLDKIYASSRVLAVQPNGYFLAIYLNGDDEQFHLFRTKVDGTVDATFTQLTFPVFDLNQSFPVVFDPLNATTLQPPDGVWTATPPVSDAQVLPNGDIILVGPFSSVAGSQANGVARIHADGSFDSSFQVGTGPQWTQTTSNSIFFPTVEQVEIRTDSKLLVAGTFEAFNGVAAPGLATLNANGSVDTSFVAPAIRQKNAPGTAVLARQSDGSFLLGGPYSRPNETEPGLIHINSTGDIPVLGSPTLATAIVGQTFDYNIVASGQPASYAVSGLPAGFSFDAGTGLISGNPASGVVGSYVITITAANADGTSAAQQVTLIVTGPAPAITSSTSVTGQTNTPFTYQITATNQPTSYRAENLPYGLTIDESTGVISGTAQDLGSTDVTIHALNAAGAGVATLNITIDPPPPAPAITSATTASGIRHRLFSYQITGTNNPFNFSASGLPPGLTTNPNTGLISGIPGSSGTFSITISATNGGGSGSAFISLTIAAEPTPPPQFANVSTRLGIGTDTNVLIGGFIITGNAPKKLVIRSIGPSLKNGSTPVPGRLSDPVLTLYDASQNVVATNDNWRSSQEQEITATTIAPSDDLEPAIVTTLAPGAYTAIVSGKNGSTGIGTVEVYDLGTASPDASSYSDLANISTRGFVQGGDNVMIGGFIISDQTTKIITRAIGPELTQYGVAGALQDTTLDLVNSNGSVIASNDDWRNTQEQAIIDSQLAPSDDREAAIVATLAPGAYTAIVRGKNNATGVATVEMYVLP